MPISYAPLTTTSAGCHTLPVTEYPLALSDDEVRRYLVMAQGAVATESEFLATAGITVFVPVPA